MKPCCENCRFWKPLNDNSGEGQCHRHAPQPINFYGLGYELLKHITILSWQAANAEEQKTFAGWEDAPGSNQFAIWVRTDRDDWCGEHKPKEP